MPTAKETREAIKDRVTIIKDVVTIIAIFGAGLWALGNFVFSEVLKPRNLHEFFQAVIEMEVAGESSAIDGVDMLPIKIVVRGENLSQKRLKIASGYMDVYADKITATQEIVSLDATIQTILNSQPKSTLDRFANKRDTELVFVSPIFAEWAFEPSERQTFQRMFRVPKNTFHQLEANIYIWFCQRAESLYIDHKVRKLDQSPWYEVKYHWGHKQYSQKEEYVADPLHPSKLDSIAAFTSSTVYLALPPTQPKSGLIDTRQSGSISDR